MQLNAQEYKKYYFERRATENRDISIRHRVVEQVQNV